MSYNNYDDWKLSNPDDDGHYSEASNRIEETVYFKYLDGRRWSFAMITTSGYDVRVHSYYNIPTIDIDEIEPTQSDVNDEIHRVRENYKEFAYIDRSEYMDNYKVAREFMDKLIDDEASN
jgi:hypothetical protein